MLSLLALQDAAGDGWLELWLQPHASLATPPFVGFNFQSARSCTGRRCKVADEVTVFGGAG